LQSDLISFIKTTWTNIQQFHVEIYTTSLFVHLYITKFVTTFKTVPCEKVCRKKKTTIGTALSTTV